MSINILIAEDNDISRQMMEAVLQTRGYHTIGVIDGQSAIDAVKEHDIDLALVDINMAPLGGFQFVEYLVAQGLDIPAVIITADDSSDILMKASALGAAQVIQKPLEPDRLLQTVSRILKRRGIKTDPLAVGTYETALSPEDLMNRAITLAESNANSGKGRPFGAVVSDQNGHILGEGVNGIASRIDPTAHAEIMAMRKAAEKLRQADLSDCTLYCSGEPTMMGKALIISAGIKTVYYGLSHDDIKSLRLDDQKVRDELSGGSAHPPVEYKQMSKDQAQAMFERVREKKT